MKPAYEVPLINFPDKTCNFQSIKSTMELPICERSEEKTRVREDISFIGLRGRFIYGQHRDQKSERRLYNPP